jgi:hypothetical protein
VTRRPTGSKTRPWPGSLGTYSQGKIDRDDKGDLLLAVLPDKKRGLVRIDFGTELSWLALDGDAAKKFAHGILRAATALETD